MHFMTLFTEYLRKERDRELERKDLEAQAERRQTCTCIYFHCTKTMNHTDLLILLALKPDCVLFMVLFFHF